MKACFTGHRPEKLGGYDWGTQQNKNLLKSLYNVVRDVIPQRHIDTLYFGGALGIDQMTFEMVKKYQENNYYDLQIILAIPFKNQPSKWHGHSDVKRYNSQIRLADKIIYVDEIEGYKFDKVAVGEYHPYKLQLRNQYMVDNSDIVLAIWNGSSGGTANCIKYAQKMGKKVIIFDPKNMMKG